MNTQIMHPHEHAVKHNRYVAATADAQAEMERQIGRNLYRRGRRITACTTDDMTAGWLAAERNGADAYWLGMMQEAN